MSSTLFPGDLFPGSTRDNLTHPSSSEEDRLTVFDSIWDRIYQLWSILKPTGDVFV